MEVIETYNPLLEQTISKFFPSIKQRKLVYKLLKKSGINSSRKFLYKSETNIRGSRAYLFPIEVLEKIKDTLDDRESTLLRTIPNGWIDLHTISSDYNIEINDIYLVFRLVGLKSEKSYRLESMTIGRKLFRIRDVKYTMSRIGRLKGHFDKGDR